MSAGSHRAFIDPIYGGDLSLLLDHDGLKTIVGVGGNGS